MNIILGLLPFIAFAVLAARIGAAVALWISVAIAVGLVLRGALMERKPVKVLEVGSALLFAALALVASFLHPSWTLFGIRTLVDVGLVAITGGSILIGRPFTLQYARERVPEAYWKQPLFIAVNRRITAVWTAAFTVEALMSAAIAWVPEVPPLLAIAVNLAALGGAVWFTVEYPKTVRARVAGSLAGQASTP